MRVQNVKAVIYDKNYKFLSGYNSITKNNKFHYSVLGGHTEKNETPIETVQREVYEESSMVLHLEIKKKKFYLVDYRKNVIPLRLDGMIDDDGKWFIFLFANVNLKNFMQDWIKKFDENQYKLLHQALFGDVDIRKIPYFLENEKLVLISPKQMRKTNGVYERQILDYI
jgi:hypothetical protein